MKNLTVALDWTPNTNHIGFFIAREKGFYKKEDLNVTIIDPSKDNYLETPAKKIELGKVDIALCPLESVISYRTKSKPFDLWAIATIFQEDISAIVTRNNEVIKSPRDLDGKIYASYKARYEDEIVRSMIKNDGGTGNIDIKYPEKLGIWDTILEGTSDATWIFLNWEAQHEDIPQGSVSYFQMKDYDIPYSYSPVIAASQQRVLDQGETYKKFLAATKKGYLFAQDQPLEAASILQKVIPEKDQSINLIKSIQTSIPYFGYDQWGQMEPDKIKLFLDWLVAHNLENNNLSSDLLFTNDYLKK